MCSTLFVCGSNAIHVKPDLDISDTYSQNKISDFSTGGQNGSDVQCCPTWFVNRTVNGVTKCECGHTSLDVICDDDKKQVLLRYVMTIKSRFF